MIVSITGLFTVVRYLVAFRVVHICDKLRLYGVPCNLIHQLDSAILVDHHNGIRHTIDDRLQKLLLCSQPVLYALAFRDIPVYTPVSCQHAVCIKKRDTTGFQYNFVPVAMPVDIFQR